MRKVAFQGGSIQVDVETVADGLGIAPSAVKDRLREGKITARYERGIAEDEGRHRLTFFTEHQRLRLVVDESGYVLQRSTLNFSNRALPASAHRQR